MSISILAVALIAVLLVLLLLALFIGGINHALYKVYRCPDCKMWWDNCGLKTTVPPDRMIAGLARCRECEEREREIT